jgi:uncharacterized membrane protein YcaP (DUF421 family)
MDIDVHKLLIIARNSIAIYLFIILAIRLFGKKELAQLSVIDLVFILLISNSVQNAMVEDDINTLAGGIAAATALFVINYILKWALRKFPRFSAVVQGHAVMLIYQGKVIAENLEKSMITLDELHACVREHGVETIGDVDLAILEVDGNISVMSRDYQHKTTRHRRSHKAVAKQQ